MADIICVPEAQSREGHLFAATTQPTYKTFALHSLSLFFFHYTPAMAQIRGTAGYHLGNQSPFGNSGRNDDSRNDPSPLDQLRAQTSKLEDMLDTVADPIKP